MTTQEPTLSPFTTLFRTTDLLRINNIWFCDNRLCTFEDRLFLIQIYDSAQHIAHIDASLYYHYNFPNSAGKSYSFYSYSLICNYLLSVYNFLLEHNKYYSELLNFADGELISLFYAFRNDTRHKRYMSILKEVRKIRQNRVLQHGLHHLVRNKKRNLLKEYSIWKCLYLVMIYGFVKTKDMELTVYSNPNN